MSKNFINNNTNSINFIYSHNHKKTLKEYEPLEKIREDFILKNTVFEKK